ncbi:MAG: ABC transporter permease [Deltaproteobacteria bacterium]|nr:ABC transporter permease [Deltaproteobacteria bacterium]
MSHLRLVLANLGRSPLRSLLTGGAIALAVLLVCILLTMPAGLDALLNRIASNTRISVVNKAGLVYPMPYAFARKIRALPGVEDAMAQVWFGGAFEEEGRVTFPNFAVETDHVERVYPDWNISPQGLADFKRYRDGAIVGRETMKKYGWKVGDRITLRSTVWPADLDLRIVAEIPSDRAPILWLNWEYLAQALEAKGRKLGIAGIVWVRVSDPKEVNSVMLRIQELTRNSEAETSTQTEKSFFSSFFGSLEGFVTILMIVTGLVSLCIVFIAGNTASMAVRERAGEIAVLKAIGFRGATIFSMLVAETVVLSVLAGGAGVGLAVLLTRALREAATGSAQLGPLGGFIVNQTVVLQGLALSLLIGLVAGLIPAWGAARKPVAQTLREIF